MSIPRSTAQQRGLIHALAAHAGMDDDTRRDFLERETGARSSTEITAVQADQVIAQLRSKSAQQAVKGLDGPIAKKLRALWIAAYNLGLARSNGDRAMLAFVERQCRVSHVRFLKEPRDGRAAVEGLKSWLARDGGVVWPLKDAALTEFKRAVLVAQWRRLQAAENTDSQVERDNPLIGLGAYARKVARSETFEGLTAAQLDQVGAALGRKLRGALARKAERERGAARTDEAAA